MWLLFLGLKRIASESNPVDPYVTPHAMFLLKHVFASTEYQENDPASFNT